jgi:GNAT superfamily N-acetyltransferase
MIGSDCPSDVQIDLVKDPGHPAFEDLVRMSRRCRMRREMCEQYLRNGAVGAMVYVLEDGQRQPAGMGWMTCADTEVPFLNARFVGKGKACLLYQDFVMPDFRGRGLQRIIGKYRMQYALSQGVHWAYGYIRRANKYSLRNAITFVPAAVVHNLHLGDWAVAHVRAVGQRQCGDLPFENWPGQRSFYIKPRRSQ